MDEMWSIDVAYYLGVSKQRVAQLASERDFLQPRHLLDGTRVRRADVVMRWAERSWRGSKPWRERPRGPSDLPAVDHQLAESPALC